MRFRPLALCLDASTTIIIIIVILQIEKQSLLVPCIFHAKITASDIKFSNLPLSAGNKLIQRSELESSQPGHIKQL